MIRCIVKRREVKWRIQDRNVSHHKAFTNLKCLELATEGVKYTSKVNLQGVGLNVDGTSKYVPAFSNEDGAIKAPVGLTTYTPSLLVRAAVRGAAERSCSIPLYTAWSFTSGRVLREAAGGGGGGGEGCEESVPSGLVSEAAATPEEISKREMFKPTPPVFPQLTARLSRADTTASSGNWTCECK